MISRRSMRSFVKAGMAASVTWVFLSQSTSSFRSPLRRPMPSPVSCVSATPTARTPANPPSHFSPAAPRGINDHAKDKALKSGLPGITEELLDRLFDGRVESNEEYIASFAAIYPLYSTRHDSRQAAAALAKKAYNFRTHNLMFGRAFRDFDIRDKLGLITAKALIVAGRHDWICPVAFSEEIERGVPNARLEVFEEAGHAVPLDCPEKYRALVRGFLSEAPEKA